MSAYPTPMHSRTCTSAANALGNSNSIPKTVSCTVDTSTSTATTPISGALVSSPVGGGRSVELWTVAAMVIISPRPKASRSEGVGW